MKIGERIHYLSNTELPDDLLKLLYNAKVMASRGHNIRSHSMCNIVELECKKRGIVIANPYHQYMMFNSKGQMVDVNI